MAEPSAMDSEPRIAPAGDAPGGAAMCMAPWVHLAVAIGGAASPCCLFDGKLGDARTETIPDIWHGQGFRDLRARLSGGTPDRRCRKCYEAEQTGGMSLREQYNGDWDGRAADLATGPDADPLKPPPPVSLDIRFNNLCNFTCRTCYHGASSKWFSDARELKWTEAPTALIESFASTEAGLAAIRPLLDKVESIYWAGGEPLLHEQHYAILGTLVEIGRTDVALSYNTNMSDLRVGQRDLLALWSRFENVFVEVSVDGTGARGELIREGMSWDNFVANAAAVKRHCPHVEIGFGITVSVFNVSVLPELYRDLLALGHAGPIGFNFHALLDPRHYSIQILPPAMKQTVARHLRAFAATLPDGEPAGETAVDRRRAAKPVRRQFLHIADHMLAADRTASLPKFRAVTLKLDAMRSRSTAEVCPELAPILRAPPAWTPRIMADAIARRLARPRNPAASA